MKPYFRAQMLAALAILAALAHASLATPVSAQAAPGGGMGEIVVTSSRQSAPFFVADRPLVGLRRPADSIVVLGFALSDSRDEAVRKQEVHTILLSVMDRAAAAGLEVVSGNFDLRPVTRANYKDLAITYGGRVDTSRVNVYIKARLTGSPAEAQAKIDSFIKSVPKAGRGSFEVGGGPLLTVKNPDQYRDAVIALIAEDARKQAAVFGPDYAAQLTGIDGSVAWSQISASEVFLYVPYRYTIVPR